MAINSDELTIYHICSILDIEVEKGSMLLSDKEFHDKLVRLPTQMAKVKFAIEQGRYGIWQRKDKEVLPEEFLQGILKLKDNHSVLCKAKTSEAEGMPQVLTFTYPFKEMGKEIQIYFKGFFKADGGLIIELSIQSLRKE